MRSNRLRQVCRCVPTSTFQSLFQALVVSRLDYYLFITPQGSTKHTQYVLWQRRHASLPTYLMRWLQSVLNSAARLIFGLRRVWLHLGCAHQHSLAAHSRAHQVLDHLSYLQSCSRPCTIVSWTITFVADLYLVVEIYDPVAPAASFNHRYIVPPSAAELFRLLALSSGTLYRWS